MKTFRFLTIALAALLAASCTFVPVGKELRGTGSRVEKDITVTDFKEIDVCQAINVVYVQRAGRPQVHIEAYENVMPLLSVSVEDGRLHLRYDDSVGSVSDVNTTVTVYAPSLESIEASSAATVQADTLNVVAELSVEASSAAQVTLGGIRAKAIEADASSAAHIRLSGNCQTVDFDASSAAHIDASALQAETGSAEASSAAGIKACVSGRFDTETSSAGSVTNTAK